MIDPFDTSHIVEATSVTPDRAPASEVPELLERPPADDLAEAVEQKDPEESKQAALVASGDDPSSNPVVPTHLAEPFNLSSDRAKEFAFENYALLERGDLDGIVDIDSEMTAISENTSRQRERSWGDVISDSIDVFGRQTYDTIRMMTVNHRASRLSDARDNGEISEEEYRARRDDNIYESESIQEDMRITGLKKQGVLGSLPSSVGEIAASLGPTIAAGSAGSFIGGGLGSLFGPGGTILGASVGGFISSWAAGAKMEADGLAGELVRMKDSEGNLIPVEEIERLKYIHGFAAGSLEALGGTLIRGASGVAGKTPLGGAQRWLRDHVKKIALTPVLRNRVVSEMGRIAAGTGGEIATESMQELISNINIEKAYRSDADFSDVLIGGLSRTGESIGQVVKTTGEGTPVIMAAMRLASLAYGRGRTSRTSRSLHSKKMADFEASEVNGREFRGRMETVVEAVKKTPMLQKYPDKTASLFGGRKVYVNAEKIVEAYKTDANPEKMSQELGPKMAEDIVSAAKEGVDIALDLSDAINLIVKNENAELTEAIYSEGKFDQKDSSEADILERVTKFGELIKQSEETDKANAEAEAEAAKTPETTPKQEQTDEVQAGPVTSPEMRTSVREDVKKGLTKLFTHRLGESFHQQGLNDSTEVIMKTYEGMAQYMGMPLDKFVDMFGLDFIPGPSDQLAAQSTSPERVGQGGKLFALHIGTAKSTSRANKFAPQTLQPGEIETAVTSDFVIHEMGHYVLNLMLFGKEISEGAATPTKQFESDRSKLMEWLKIKDGELDKMLTKTNYRMIRHETMAEAFQTYFREGKAPTPGLQGVFQRLGRWLAGIYRTVGHIREFNNERSFARAQLDSDIREIFDRVYSVETEVLAETADYSSDAFFNALVLAGAEESMAVEIMEGWNDLHDRLMGEQFQASIKQLNAEQTKARTEFVKEETERLVEELRQAHPVYRLIETFVHSDQRLNKAKLIEALGGGNQDVALEALRGFYDDSGTLDPQSVAISNGFKSTIDMGAKIASTPPIYEAGRNLADANADQRFPETAFGPKDLDETVVKAAMMKIRPELAQYELNALERFSDLKTSDYRNQVAKDFVYKQKASIVGDGRQYLKRAQEWGIKAAEFLIAKDYENFYKAKSKQIGLDLAGKHARAFYDLTVQTTAMAKMINSKKYRAKAEAADPSILKLIDATLGGIDIGPTEQSGSDSRNIESFKFHEMDGLNARLAEILSFVKKAEKANRELKEAKIAELTSTSIGVEKGVGTISKFINNRFTAASNVGMTFMKAEFILKIMDRAKRMGPWTKAIFRPIRDAQNAFYNERDVYRAKLKELVEKHFKKDELNRMGLDTITLNDGTTLTREEALSIVLNSGNEGNLKRLQNMKITENKLNEIRNKLPQNYLEYAQDIWNYIDSFWSRIEQLELRTKGEAPKRVIPKSFKAHGKTYKGGYYPIVYDYKALKDSQKIKDLSPDQLLGESTSGEGVRATTLDGHKEARAENVNVPLSLDLRIIQGHIKQVVYDLHFHEPVLDVAAILRKTAIKNALNQGIGEGTHRQLAHWLRMVARDASISERSEFTGLAGKVRRNVTFGIMAGNLGVAYVQMLGLFPSMAEVGVKNIAKTAASLLVGRGKTVEKFNIMRKRSAMMRNRMTTFERDPLEYAEKTIFRTKVGGKISGAYQWAKNNAFALIGMMDMVVSFTTWQAAFDAAIEGSVEGVNPTNMKDAIHYADSAVTMTQGSGGATDLARIQNLSETTKALTIFMGYFNTMWNRFIMTKRGAAAGDISKGKAFKEFTLVFIIPPIIEEFMRGHAEEDEEAIDTFKRYALAVPLSGGPLAAIPLVRGLSSMLKGYDYSASPIVATIESGFKTISETAPKIFDEEATLDANDRKRFLKGLSIFTSIPATQLNRMLDAFVLFLNDDDFGAGDLASASVKGLSEEDRKLSLELSKE